MPITKERFEQGLRYDEYKAQMTRNRERFEANEETVQIAPSDQAFFSELPAALPVLVLAEDWCGDVIANLPVLGSLASASGKLDIRVFPRDQNLDIMDQYLKDGLHRSIPVFVVFDAEFRELGHWIERPARMSESQQQMVRDLFTREPMLRGISPDTSIAQLPEEARNRLGQAFGTFREENRQLSDHEVVRELRSIIEHGTAQPVAAEHRAVPASVTDQQGSNGHAEQRVKVAITYCAACGYEPQTLALTSALMHEFVYDLASIELIPWHDGTFDVVVGGDLVHSMLRDGGFPEHSMIIQAVRERLAH